MGYLFIAIALLAGATKGYCGKKTSGYTENSKDAVAFSFLRMIFCIVVGALVVATQGSIKYLAAPLPIILISALSGVTTSIFVVSWLISVKKGSYTMIDVFLMIGTLVPLLLGQALFGEIIALKQWIGFVILIIAVAIMCSYNNTIKEKISPFSMFLLIVCGVSSGLADFSQKLFVKQATEIPASVFNFYTYVFSALTLLVFYIYFSIKQKGEEKSGVQYNGKVFVYIGIMAACLFINSYFKTLAAGYLDSAKLYPLNQGLALVISLFMSSVLFKEKLTAKSVFGVALAFLGLLIINVL